MRKSIRAAIAIENEAIREIEDFQAESDWDFNDEISEAYSFIDSERDYEEES